MFSLRSLRSLLTVLASPNVVRLRSSRAERSTTVIIESESRKAVIINDRSLHPVCLPYDRIKRWVARVGTHTCNRYRL